jgi:hypothetical protein
MVADIETLPLKTVTPTFKVNPDGELVAFTLEKDEAGIPVFHPEFQAARHWHDFMDYGVQTHRMNPVGIIRINGAETMKSDAVALLCSCGLRLFFVSKKHGVEDLARHFGHTPLYL